MNLVGYFAVMLSSLLLLSLATSAGPEPSPAFVGSWVGTLEYRDYSDDSREKLGTLLRIYRPKGSSSWVFRYVYDDGPKKVLQESQTVTLDWTHHKYVSTSEDGKDIDTYDVDGSNLKPDGTGTIVLRGKGTENRLPVEIRQTLTISDNHLDILRESQIKGQEFKFRHRYSFTRVDL